MLATMVSFWANFVRLEAHSGLYNFFYKFFYSVEGGVTQIFGGNDTFVVIIIGTTMLAILF